MTCDVFAAGSFLPPLSAISLTRDVRFASRSSWCTLIAFGIVITFYLIHAARGGHETDRDAPRPPPCEIQCEAQRLEMNPRLLLSVALIAVLLCFWLVMTKPI